MDPQCRARGARGSILAGPLARARARISPPARNFADAMSNFAGSTAAGVGSQVVFAGRTLDTIAWNGTTWTDVGVGPDLDACDNGLMMAPVP